MVGGWGSSQDWWVGPHSEQWMRQYRSLSGSTTFTFGFSDVSSLTFVRNTPFRVPKYQLMKLKKWRNGSQDRIPIGIVIHGKDSITRQHHKNGAIEKRSSSLSK